MSTEIVETLKKLTLVLNDIVTEIKIIRRRQDALFERFKIQDSILEEIAAAQEK